MDRNGKQNRNFSGASDPRTCELTAAELDCVSGGMDRRLVCHLFSSFALRGHARFRSFHRNKPDHDIIATKTATQITSTAQFE
jgi:hypothetical protein